MNSTIKFVILLLVTFFATSCKKETMVSASKDKNFEFLSYSLKLGEDIKVIDGAIHFKNDLSFIETMNYLHKNGQAKLIDFEKLIGFNKSLRAKMVEDFDSIQNMNINIIDLFFATVVNEKGIYFIDNTIYKVTDKYEYALKNGDEKKLSDLISGQMVSNSKELIVRKITGSDNTQVNRDFFGESEYKTHWMVGNVKKRVRMNAWSRNYLKYSSSGVNIYTESYRKGGLFGRWSWRDSAVKYLRVDAETKCYAEVNGEGAWEIIKDSEDAHNADHIQTVLEYVVAVIGGGWLTTEYIKCTYTYIRDDNGELVNEFFHFN